MQKNIRPIQERNDICSFFIERIRKPIEIAYAFMNMQNRMSVVGTYSLKGEIGLLKQDFSNFYLMHLLKTKFDFHSLVFSLRLDTTNMHNVHTYIHTYMHRYKGQLKSSHPSYEENNQEQIFSNFLYDAPLIIIKVR